MAAVSPVIRLKAPFASRTYDRFAGLDEVQYFADRSLQLPRSEGRLQPNHRGARGQAEVQRNPVPPSRPDADRLGVDEAATSLTGHAGSCRFARSGNSKWRWANATRWVSPGFDLNDMGVRRRAISS